MSDNEMAEKFVEAAVKSDQLKQLQAALERKPKEDAKRITRDALELGGLAYLRAVESEAPKRSGFLAKHFNIKFSFRGSNGTSGAAFIGPDGRMDYPLTKGGYKKRKGSRKIGRIPVISVARFDEFGTSKQSANPFITRAFEIAKGLALSRVIAAIKQGLGL